MKPVEFPEQNVVFAKDQEEYLSLPAIKNEEGDIVCCWELSEEEKETLMKTGKIWVYMKTFNKPLQPLLLSVNKEELIKEQ